MAEKTVKSTKKTSTKHLQIDKDQSTILVVVAVSVVLTIFCLFAAKALISKGLYQRRVLTAQHKVVNQLKANLTAANTLFTQYSSAFAKQDPNMLGGSLNGSGNLDGDNPRLTLDALPSTYDAPALATSLEKIITGRSMTINSITVTDSPTTYPDQPQAMPQPKAVTFQFEASGNYQQAQQLLQDFERSIRPFDLNTLEIAGTDQSLKLTAGMTTYYQPAKSLNLQATKEVN
ncbi:MAG TPA: hypothetical protein VFH37_02975 [Candidatus Saccharimonadales bacterium]|nr:hypothetical protein [Candidatus Saccharimonadales bacterium]